DSLPWRREDRVLLTDTAAARPAVPLLDDLRTLTAETRAVFVLERVAALPTWQIALVLGVPTDRVPELALTARTALVARDPERADDALLAAELTRARHAFPPAAVNADLDVAHGRMLARRRWLRRGVAAGTALAVVAGGAAQLSRSGQEPTATRPPASTRTTGVVPSLDPPPLGPPVTCDPAAASCRARVLKEWRQRMADVTSEYLDPQGAYFSGFAYAYNALYETPAFWSGGRGALGLDVFGKSDRTTEVFLQIATDRASAPRCGRATGQPCVSTRFMDGNRFLLTETTKAFEGIEVQYNPYGDQVITVVVRDVADGRPLDVDRSVLLELVQDERLRLPAL
ncbi:MAG: hypothetical protein ACLGIF_04220, partial [Actinomycetes bacterium]